MCNFLLISGAVQYFKVTYNKWNLILQTYMDKEYSMVIFKINYEYNIYRKSSYIVVGIKFVISF